LPIATGDRYRNALHDGLTRYNLHGYCGNWGETGNKGGKKGSLLGKTSIARESSQKGSLARKSAGEVEEGFRARIWGLGASEKWLGVFTYYEKGLLGLRA